VSAGFADCGWRATREQRFGVIRHPIVIVGGRAERGFHGRHFEVVGGRAYFLGSHPPRPDLASMLADSVVFLAQERADGGPRPRVQRLGEQALVAFDVGGSHERSERALSFDLFGDLREA
jgi:hypothetical protein